MVMGIRVSEEEYEGVDIGEWGVEDSGYQGIKKVHEYSETPHKSTKKSPLSKGEKKENHALSSQRTVVENVIGSVKKFRILKHVYRNRRKRFSLRFNLISAICNFEP